MKLTSWLSLLAAGALAVAAPVAVYLSFHPTQESASVPELKDLLNWQVLPRQTKLYSHQDEPENGAPSAVSPPDRESAILTGEKRDLSDIYQPRRDGSFDIIKPQPGTVAGDKVREQSVLTYFAKQPGEAYWRLHSRQFFDLDQTLISEDGLRLDFSAERHGFRHDDGNYELVIFYEDGETPARRIITPPPGKASAPLLEERWRSMSEGHAMTFSNYRDAAGNRTVTDYTLRHDHAYPFKITESSESGIYGTRVRAWYPGTDILRLECNSNYSGTKASFYRQNTTLFRTLELGRLTHSDTFFADDGKTALYTQSWDVIYSGENNSEKKEVLSVIAEKTPDLKVSRLLEFDNRTGKLTKITRFHFSEEGVSYKMGEYKYQADSGDSIIGALTHSELTPEDEKLPVKIDDYGPSRAGPRPDIPALELLPPDMSDNLPIGPENRMGPR
jgi:hypothetical protein